MNPIRSFALACSPLLLTAACAGPAPLAWDGPEAAAIEAELMAADRAFAAETAADGIEGWMRYFHEDAARPEFGGENRRGLAAIRAADAVNFANPELRLAWDPVHAGAFADGRHGYTMGRFQVLHLAAEPPTVLGEGWYLSWWRWQDGGWKVILDTGVPDPAPAPEVGAQP